MSTRILIVEDDEALARVLRGNLVFEGFAVECVADGEAATRVARETKPDLILLDVTIPGLDGFEVCRVLNSGRHRMPIIMLTARTQIEHKLRGLALGADDYVTKPFVFAELVARMHAVLRRSQHVVEALRLGNAVIDFERMHATRAGQPLPLTAREFAFLQYLAERENRVVSREELLLGVWGYDHIPLTRTVDNFVARLRRKIEDDAQHPRFVRTVHGGGYRLTVPGASE
jgi:DNA-binding response OmpR family regulator